MPLPSFRTTFRQPAQGGNRRAARRGEKRGSPSPESEAQGCTEPSGMMVPVSVALSSLVRIGTA